MDLGSITAVAGSLKTAAEIAKFIKDSDFTLERAELNLKLAELMAALGEARMEMGGLQMTLATAEGRIHEMERQLKVKSTLIYEPPAYWTEENGRRDGPFCQRCYDAEGKLVRLQESNGVRALACRSCSSAYRTDAGKRADEADAAAIQRHNRSARI